MSATKPASRTEFKNYCLRQLGAPVIQINVAESQIEDRVDEALTYFQMNHFDGSEHQYIPFEVTPSVLVSRNFEVDDSIISIKSLIDSGVNTSNQFSLEWQMMSATMPFALKGDGLLTFSLAMQYRETLKMIVTGKHKTIRYSRHTNQLNLDADWSQLKVGQIFVAEVYRALDPNDFPRVWNDGFLKRYCIALIKRQWGNNLRKLVGVQLPGGVTIDGAAILQEAEEEIKEMKDEVLTDYQEPIDFYMG